MYAFEVKITGAICSKSLGRFNIVCEFRVLCIYYWNMFQVTRWGDLCVDVVLASKELRTRLQFVIYTKCVYIS